MRAGATLALLALTLAGCASYDQIYSPRRAPDPTATGTSAAGSADAGVSSPETDAPRENAASAVLLSQSREERAAGNLAGAAAAVERALALDPNNPALWIELAEIRAAEGDREQADSLARKALTLAGNDRSIAARADRLTRR